VYSSSIGLCRSDLNFRADLKGREEYNQYIQNTPRNCVFNSMAEARAEAKSENEAYLLDHYSPFCKVITNQYSNAFFHEEKLL